jgi:pimeloyl-ACP methyl ester carboxylesterase
VWNKFVDGYLAAGYAVFDVNGCGPVSVTGASHDYGAFGALQAAYKAYKYIVDKYNVEERIFVHGSSMGGVTAYAFVKAYGGIVDAVGLFAPAMLSRSAQMDSVDDYIAVNYGYEDVAEMTADNYANLISANPHIDYYDAATGAKVVKPFTYDCVNNYASDGLDIYCDELRKPIKIWCGTSDTSVDPNYGDALAKAITNSGGLAVFRPISGGTHNAGLGNNSIVISEAVMWFDRFK